MVSQKYITGRDIIDYGIRGFELLEFVRKGLQPYNDLGRPIPPPDVLAKNSLLENLQTELKKLKEGLRTHREFFKDLKERREDHPVVKHDAKSRREFAEHIAIHMDYSKAHKVDRAVDREEDYSESKILDNLIKQTQETIRTHKRETKGYKTKVDTLSEELSCLHDDSWKNYSLPDSESEAKLVLDSLSNMLFKKKEFLKLHDGSTIKKREKWDNSTFSENRLKRIALRARENAAVRLIDLIYFMTEEEKYSDLLFELWDSYDLNSKNNNLMPQNICNDVSLRTKQARAGVWWWLFARLAVTSEGRFYFKKLPEMTPLFPLYYDVECARKVEDINSRSEDCYVKLNDFALGLERIEKNHGLNVPLPSRLFPDRKHVNGKTSQSPAQEGKTVSPGKPEPLRIEQKGYYPMNREVPQTESPLNGWKQIASHVGVHPDTARKKYKLDGMPVHKSGNSKQSGVIAFPSELNEWMVKRKKKKDPS